MSIGLPLLARPSYNHLTDDIKLGEETAPTWRTFNCVLVPLLRLTTQIPHPLIIQYSERSLLSSSAFMCKCVHVVQCVFCISRAVCCVRSVCSIISIPFWLLPFSLLFRARSFSFFFFCRSGSLIKDLLKLASVSVFHQLAL